MFILLAIFIPSVIYYAVELIRDVAFTIWGFIVGLFALLLAALSASP